MERIERKGMNMGKNYRAELTGVFGDPVDGNPTGVMTEAAYEAMGQNFRYITMKVTKEDFPDAMRAVKALHMKGVNLTMPHKIAVLSWLDELSPAASIIGAVNTVVVREDGTLFGENTDGKGFIQALANAGEQIEGKTITILGAGGAARAIAVEAGLAGAKKITVINRTEAKAQELAELVRGNSKAEAAALAWEDGQKIPEDTDILINATPVGLAPDIGSKPAIDYDTVKAGMVVSDVVFNPAVTPSLTEAEARGAKTVSGLGMLACQGARNITLWTRQEAPLELMEKVLAQEFA